LQNRTQVIDHNIRFIVIADCLAQSSVNLRSVIAVSDSRPCAHEFRDWPVRNVSTVTEASTLQHSGVLHGPQERRKEAALADASISKQRHQRAALLVTNSSEYLVK
jgi:hypothetical protein